MKTIGNIYLSWRKGKGVDRKLVGIIKRNATTGTRFSYLEKGVADAQKEGFTCYEGFPDTSRKYSENVIEIFGQRIMRSERVDVTDFFDFWKIDPKHKEDSYYMLAYTQGMLPTDNFEFLADFNPVKGLSFISEITQLSNYNHSADVVSVGDTLSYEKEPKNQVDKKAVKVFNRGVELGYVKRIHSRLFYKTNNPINIKVHHIEKNGSLNRVFVHIFI